MASRHRPQISSRTITEIAHEQHEVQELLSRLERGAGDIAQRAQLRDQVVTELVERVSRAERLIYRAVRALLHDGWELAREQFPGRARTRRLMHRLDGLEPTHPTFEPLVRSVVTRVRRQIAEDRATVLPRLVDAATPLSWVGRDEPVRARQLVDRRAS